MSPPASLLSPTTWTVLWLVVVVELLSPLPAVLTCGAVYVLIARPPWFLQLVRALYGER